MRTREKGKKYPRSKGVKNIDLPPVENHQVIEYLCELGFCNLGPEPLGWTDIKSWCELTKTTISTWEANALRHLSCVYAGAINEYNDSDSPPPYLSDDMRLELMRRKQAKLRGR